MSDIKKGESFSPENVRSIRPGFGLHTKYYDQIIGKTAVNGYKKGNTYELEFNRSGGILNV